MTNCRLPLEKFYENKTVLVTGCTGFLGIILVEKLLRSFSTIRRLILVIRPKKDESVEDRIRSYVNNQVFSRLDPRIFEEKVSWINGDLLLDNCGFSTDDMETVKSTVNIIFHSAATVRFVEPLRTALLINLKGTQEVLKIASEIKNLECFMYVSTAYSNCHQTTIEERLYDNKFSPDALLKMLEVFDEEMLEKLTPIVVQNWPNTYTFSKNATEHLVHEYQTTFRVGIFRPAAIIASYKEPFPSWLNKDIGTNFIIVSVGMGLLRVVCANDNSNSCLVPVDMTANALIATAWDVHQSNENKLKIYNYTSFENRLRPTNYIQFSIKELPDYPFDCAYSYPSLIIVKSMWLFRFLALFLHWIPAYFLDLYGQLIGDKPKLKRIYEKLHKRIGELQFFIADANWTFASDNINSLWRKLTTDEKETMYFDVKSMDWKECLSMTPIGVKKYMFEDDLSEEGVKNARRKYKRFALIYMTVKYTFVSLLLYITLRTFLWFTNSFTSTTPVL